MLVFERAKLDEISVLFHDIFWERFIQRFRTPRKLLWMIHQERNCVLLQQASIFIKHEQMRNALHFIPSRQGFGEIFARFWHGIPRHVTCVLCILCLILVHTQKYHFKVTIVACILVILLENRTEASAVSEMKTNVRITSRQSTIYISTFKTYHGPHQEAENRRSISLSVKTSCGLTDCCEEGHHSVSPNCSIMVLIVQFLSSVKQYRR